jgi:hypothetical protein
VHTLSLIDFLTLLSDFVASLHALDYLLHSVAEESDWSTSSLRVSAADQHQPSFKSNLRALISQVLNDLICQIRILMTMLLDSLCRPVPDGISPFSKGCTTNLFNFCCTSTSNVPVYELPSLDELRARSLTSSWWENDYYSCC